MCGLVGTILKTMSGGNNMDVSLFSDMLYMDALRGMDSTGVASFHNNGEVNILKEASDAGWFLRAEALKKFNADFVKTGKAIIGHNRKATVGKTTDNTAHPFLLEDDEGPRWAFTHNGTLRNHEKIFKTEVDSEALGMLLTQAGEDQEALEKALERVEGAYACVWIDQKTEKIYLLRNKERPLFLAETSWGYLYASEPMMIYAAAARNSTKVSEIKALDEHTLYSIDLKDVKLELKETKLVVKKSFPLLLQNTKKGGNGIAANSAKFCEGEVSKNEYKRIRKNFTGKSLTLWVGVFRPRIAGSGTCTEWIIEGDSSTLAFDHQCIGWTKDMTEEEMLYFGDNIPFTGIISEVLYDAKNKQVTLMMGELTMVSANHASQEAVLSKVNFMH